MRNITIGLLGGALMRMAAMGKAPAREQRRALRQFGALRAGRSGGSIRRALNLRGLQAFNEYRPQDAHDAPGGTVQVRQLEHASTVMWAEYCEARNAAKARRRALRAQGARP